MMDSDTSPAPAPLIDEGFDGVGPFDPSGSLATDQVEEMVAAWRRGERPRAEDYLARSPGLADEAVIRLIFEECSLREDAGESVDRAELARRFPRWGAEVAMLLDCRRLMQGGTSIGIMPAIGDRVAEFRILHELGRGVSGHVYLAAQPELADRPVVLKVTHVGRDEHLSLARLQHMNIVPLYSAQLLPDRRLQVLCMPFLGGASLTQVLDALKDLPAPTRTGEQLIEALDGLQSRLPATLPARGPFRRYVAGAPYVDAICWIGVCLADGLHYAHERQFVHMDIKPSNVLLAGDAQPMLLDFHLAREPIEPGNAPPGWMGGTPGYMAPEQADALAAVREGRPVLTAVDRRADVYALGLLLYEALGGVAPRPNAGPLPPLRRCNPRVSTGLADIIAKCLRPDPADRYPDAAALASDLRRSLDGVPLQGVPNRSLTERWRNWRRRRPHALARSLVLVVAALTTAAGAGLLWSVYRQRTDEVASALAAGQNHLARRQYAESLASFRRGLDLAANLPGAGAYRRALDTAAARARRDAKAADLHRLAELIRFRYGIDPPPADEAQAMMGHLRATWQARGALFRSLPGPPASALDPSVRADLIEVALVWASLLARSSSTPDPDRARGEALQVLAEAAERLGPSPALEREQRVLANPGREAAPAVAAESVPRTAWEHYDLGRSYLRSGDIDGAAEQFALGLRLRPQDFWLNFYQGLTAYRLGRADDAANSFRVCVALSPETAECFYNKALAESALGRTDDAIWDYTAALERAPALSEAALNRGILHYHAGHLGTAMVDLDTALANAAGNGDRAVIRYNQALVALGRGDREQASVYLDEAVRLGHASSRTLAERLRREAGQEPHAR